MTVGEPSDDAEGSYCSRYRAKTYAMGPNRRAQERERAAAEAPAKAKRARPNGRWPQKRRRLSRCAPEPAAMSLINRCYRKESSGYWVGREAINVRQVAYLCGDNYFQRRCGWQRLFRRRTACQVRASVCTGFVTTVINVPAFVSE
jgi:hypothetical protein